MRPTECLEVEDGGLGLTWVVVMKSFNYVML